MMEWVSIVIRHARAALILLLAGVCSLATALAALDVENLADLLSRVENRTSVFLDLFSNVKCTELVLQEKISKENKAELKKASTYDYLVILTNAGGELNLSESRIGVKEAKRDRKNTSMLLSNGFAMLFLVFHPSYADSFKFTFAGDEMVDGRRLEKISFEHVLGRKSPAALALRGREYPLELAGTAWIDSETGSIVKIDAEIGDSLGDVGLKTLSAEINFAPLKFPDSKEEYWFPTQARVEVETPRQHWRNLHQFTAYRKFSVSTEELIKQ